MVSKVMHKWEFREHGTQMPLLRSHGFRGGVSVCSLKKNDFAVGETFILRTILNTS